jgi:hypothetical protein
MSNSRRSFLRKAGASAIAAAARPLFAGGRMVPAVNGSASGLDGMKLAFGNPPNSARPRVWWHWMNGNITKEGIRLDLEWMHRVGLGGVTVFQGSIDTPQVVKQRLVYMTLGWKDAFHCAATTAENLGLEMAIASSPGWSETGGPWVPPAQGMKKVVWSETRIEGGKPFTGRLPQPPDVSGTFQNYDVRSEADELEREKTAPLPRFYADSAVVAYRAPAADKTQAEMRSRITSSGGQINTAALSDGDVQTVAVNLPYAAPGETSWIQFDYARPQIIQSLTMASLDDMISIFGFDDPNAIYPQLEASDDGQKFRHVVDILPSSVPQRTVAFPAVKAKYFRVSFPGPASGSVAKPGNHAITELVLSSTARVNQFEKRAGFATVEDYYAIPTPPATPDSLVASHDVVDLSSKMGADGQLDWNPPEGTWVILRIGYSLTGHENGPAPAEATGLEVDKLNRQYVGNYVQHYLKTYSDTVGPGMIGKHGISYMLSDSSETGAQNWTDTMLTEFRDRRGYDAHPWLPVLTGVIVQSPEASDRFLWDFRRTIAELFAQNHYGEIAAQVHRHGMGYYSEALEYHRPSLGDDMEMRRFSDIPMGAMWTYTPDQEPTPTYIADLRGAASVSHIYGQNLVGAESMTSNGPAWGWAPNTLKTIADLEFALGVNRFMIHESAHQPLVNKPPGLTLGNYGLWFNRYLTWAEQAGPWVEYLARCSYLLQQGHFYADVAYFYGQEGPLTAVFGLHVQEDAPEGYGFDFVNADVILNQLSFQGGRLVTPGGTSYRLLYLGGTSKRMTLPVLRKIRELISEGAIVAGNRPVDSPSLADDQAEFQSIVGKLWGGEDAAGPLVRTFGKGKIYSGRTANEVLGELALARDFEYTRPKPDTELMFVHRKLPDGDVYFVSNRKDRIEHVDVTLRVAGKSAELWHPDTGATRPASYRTAMGRTTVSLQLNPNETVFVVFRQPSSEAERALPSVSETPILHVEGAWTVSFEPNLGAPEKITLDKLASWSDNAKDGVKYFSGTATYTKTIHVAGSSFKPGERLWLDLGDVRELASVTVNGRKLGIVWKAPFRLEVTDAIRPGTNMLAIKVTNLWVNRLIGDQQPNALKKYTFATFKPYTAGSPLSPSGLLGPVRIVSERNS